LVEWDDECV
jgi:hypothetical protein